MAASRLSACKIDQHFTRCHMLQAGINNSNSEGLPLLDIFTIMCPCNHQLVAEKNQRFAP